MAYENIAHHIPVLSQQDVTVETTHGATLNPAQYAYIGTKDTRFLYCLYKTDGTRSRVTRVLTADDAPSDWRLGSVVKLTDYVDSKDLGRYKIVGLRDVEHNEGAGDLPDRNDIKWGIIRRVW